MSEFLTFLFKMFNSDEFDGLVRHALTVLGGMAIVTGHFDPAAWQTISGGVVTFLVAIWSVASKKYLKAGGTNV